MKIAVLDWYTVNISGDIPTTQLEELGDVKIIPLTKPEETAANIGDADIVLCNKVLITKEVMDACPNIKYVGLFATGFNNVDIDYAAQKGIAVCNAGQYSTNAVAQQTFAYILDRFSRVRDYDTAVKNGEWERSPAFSYFPVPTSELAGKTLSIVGFGSIGRKVAEIGSAFGMNIVVSTRTQPKDCPYEVTDLFTAAEKADVLTFHCPLTDKTAGIINKELFSHMKSSAMLVNTSRGGVVNEADLAEALNSGKIAAAYLDVLVKEPMSPDTPLKGAKNCVITPHTAWAPLETRQRLVDIVCDNIRAWQNGSPKNKVN
ncbi:D-2-hydroxyacid dehydrogenase [Ruminococcus flavefaciens]|uniref:Glycerate dehydrogenase n=1 Tax=Ruminococcus flavefaciens TaxID=1265 RepID=A0A1K1Q168_RUMFL|nr:D-2-hydroxyacid dehydrogenase [Ruminococcus flavefaciens]SFW53481.1 glycerate dehydrogenase [Ruminococcus flavefaciens]